MKRLYLSPETVMLLISAGDIMTLSAGAGEGGPMEVDFNDIDFT